MSKREGLLNNAWEETQIKVFGRWVDKQLSSRQLKFGKLLEDFEDGVNLINLLEIVGKEPIGGKYHAKPKLRVQKLENVDLALKYVQEIKKIRLVGIGSADIVDKNSKLTLGLTWSIINKFQIEEISVEEATARDALLLWAKKNTAGYEGVNVTNFTSSWSSGLAFCALINKFRPNLLDYSALNKENHTENVVKAFEACKALGIYVYLDPEDLVDITPDEKSVVTQVSEFFHFFASESKVGVMADKIKKTVAIQKLIDELNSTYVADAKIALQRMEEELAKLTADDYEKTVPGIKAKLVQVIKYGRDARPEIVEYRAKALRSWAALVTKCKSSTRPVPVPPTGLEPETLNCTFKNLEETATSRRNELTGELKNMQNSKVDAFNCKCVSIQGTLAEIQAMCEVSGSLEEQKVTLEKLLEQASQTKPLAKELDEPYAELVDLKLNTRAKFTNISIANEVEQINRHISRLIEQNKAAIFEESNRKRIEEYNQFARKYVDDAKSFESSVVSISGDLVSRRTELLQKQNELPSKRDSVNSLAPHFQDLEKDGLHLGVENTPASIQAIYGNILSIITTELGKIYSEMVSSFDKQTVAIVETIKSTLQAATSLEGNESLPTLQGYLPEIQQLQDKIPELNAPFEELSQFHLNFKAKYTSNDVKSEYEQCIATLKHLIMSKESSIAENERNARVEAYNTKASSIMTKAETLESSIDSVEGDFEPKRAQLYSIQTKVQQESQSVDEIGPIYEDLEKDELHLEISLTPTSLKAFFNNLVSHIDTLVREIDSAIAAQKGIQVSEEQLAEFRETFSHFDKDKSNTLEYFELKACLTALGETSTDEECKAIIAKYSGAANLDFEGYVKFMLDRFSKAETRESTLEAFRAVAANSPVINDTQLAQYFSPEDAEYLKTKMTPVEGGYDFAAWVQTIYA